MWTFKTSCQPVQQQCNESAFWSAPEGCHGPIMKTPAIAGLVSYFLSSRRLSPLELSMGNRQLWSKKYAVTCWRKLQALLVSHGQFVAVFFQRELLWMILWQGALLCTSRKVQKNPAVGVKSIYHATDFHDSVNVKIFSNLWFFQKALLKSLGPGDPWQKS